MRDANAIPARPRACPDTHASKGLVHLVPKSWRLALWHRGPRSKIFRRMAHGAWRMPFYTVPANFSHQISAHALYHGAPHLPLLSGDSMKAWACRVWPHRPLLETLTITSRVKKSPTQGAEPVLRQILSISVPSSIAAVGLPLASISRVGGSLILSLSLSLSLSFSLSVRALLVPHTWGERRTPPRPKCLGGGGAQELRSPGALRDRCLGFGSRQRRRTRRLRLTRGSGRCRASAGGLRAMRVLAAARCRAEGGCCDTAPNPSQAEASQEATRTHGSRCGTCLVCMYARYRINVDRMPPWVRPRLLRRLVATLFFEAIRSMKLGRHQRTGSAGLSKRIPGRAFALQTSKRPTKWTCARMCFAPAASGSRSSAWSTTVSAMEGRVEDERERRRVATKANTGTTRLSGNLQRHVVAARPWMSCCADVRLRARRVRHGARMVPELAPRLDLWS